jgi:hypothetical protein
MSSARVDHFSIDRRCSWAPCVQTKNEHRKICYSLL